MPVEGQPAHALRGDGHDATTGPPMSVETIRRGRRFDFQVVRETLPTGRVIEREVVRHPGAAVVLALDDAGRIAMIRNWRVAVGRWVWELPAGTLEPPEPADRCAARELEEEAGLRAARLEHLGVFYTTPGMTDERMHAFLATGLARVGQRLEDDERIEVHPTPVHEALAMIDDGRLMDAKSLLAILLAHRRGLLPDA